MFGGKLFLSFYLLLTVPDFETFYCSVIGFIVHCFPDMEGEALNHFLTLSFTFVSNTLRQYGLKV